MDAVTPSPAVAATRFAAVACVLGLIVLGLSWELWLSPLRPGGSLWALKVLPLAVPLVGMLKYRMRSYRAASLWVWLYFTEGVVRASAEHGPGVALALGQTALCLGLFAACALQVRLRLRSTVAATPVAA